MDPTCAARTLAGLRLRHRNHLQRVHSHRRVVASRLQMNRMVKLSMRNVLQHPETSVEGATALQTRGTKYMPFGAGNQHAGRMFQQECDEKCKPSRIRRPPRSARPSRLWTSLRCWWL